MSARHPSIQFYLGSKITQDDWVEQVSRKRVSKKVLYIAFEARASLSCKQGFYLKGVYGEDRFCILVELYVFKRACW